MKNTTAFVIASLLALALSGDAATASARTRAPFFGSPDETRAAQTQQQQPRAQPTPSPTPKDEDAQPSTPAGEDRSGDYTVISGIELGVRGLGVDGDHEKYRADLNYRPGFRLFDSSILVRAGDGDGPLFDNLVVNASGFGADPHGSLRVNADNGRWYKFDLNYRRNRYVNRLITLARGDHYRNTTHNLGDFDLRLLPTNKRIRFNLGASFDRNGSEEPGTTTYDALRDEFVVRHDYRTRAEEYRGGVEGRVGKLDLGFLVGTRGYRDDSTYFITQPEAGSTAANRPAVLNTFRRDLPTHGRAWFTRLSAHTTIAERVDLTARYTYSHARTRFFLSEVVTGINANRQTIERNVSEFAGESERPAHLFDFGVTWQPTDRLRISNTVRYNRFRNEGAHVFSDINFLRTQAGAVVTPFPSTVTVPVARLLEYRRIHNQLKVDYQFGPRFSFHLGHRVSDRDIEIDKRGNSVANNAAFAETESIETLNNSFFGGFKARPVKAWTLYFDFERGEADNTFTRVDNLDQISFRARSRVTPARGLGISLAFSTRDNSDPGLGVVDTTLVGPLDSSPFSVEVDSRVFSTTVDWAPPSGRYTLNAGYTYTYLHSDAEILYFAGLTPNTIRFGRSLYDVRDSFFFFNASARLHRLLSAYAGYRVHRDAGDRNETDAVGGLFARSYPLRFQSPEVRLIFRLHRKVDWNVGYQYYEYKERLSDALNYRAHLPYTSLRFYWGGGER